MADDLAGTLSDDVVAAVLPWPCNAAGPERRDAYRSRLAVSVIIDDRYQRYSAEMAWW
jgi:hypothetical protein